MIIIIIDYYRSYFCKNLHPPYIRDLVLKKEVEVIFENDVQKKAANDNNN